MCDAPGRNFDEKIFAVCPVAMVSLSLNGYGFSGLAAVSLSGFHMQILKAHQRRSGLGDEDPPRIITRSKQSLPIIRPRERIDTSRTPYLYAIAQLGTPVDVFPYE
jgi:hypothetical protein